LLKWSLSTRIYRVYNFFFSHIIIKFENYMGVGACFESLMAIFDIKKISIKNYDLILEFLDDKM
jgi:hypothetical protein